MIKALREKLGCLGGEASPLPTLVDEHTKCSQETCSCKVNTKMYTHDQECLQTHKMFTRSVYYTCYPIMQAHAHHSISASQGIYVYRESWHATIKT